MTTTAAAQTPAKSCTRTPFKLSLVQVAIKPTNMHALMMKTIQEVRLLVHSFKFLLRVSVNLQTELFYERSKL